MSGPAPVLTGTWRGDHNDIQIFDVKSETLTRLTFKKATDVEIAIHRHPTRSPRMARLSSTASLCRATSCCYRSKVSVDHGRRRQTTAVGHAEQRDAERGSTPEPCWALEDAAGASRAPERR